MINLNKYDVIQWIGSKACAAGTEATRFIVDQPGCSHAEAWNTGGLLLMAVLMTIGVLFINRRRKTHRENFFR